MVPVAVEHMHRRAARADMHVTAADLNPAVFAKSRERDGACGPGERRLPPGRAGM